MVIKGAFARTISAVENRKSHKFINIWSILFPVNKKLGRYQAPKSSCHLKRPRFKKSKIFTLNRIALVNRTVEICRVNDPHVLKMCHEI